MNASDYYYGCVYVISTDNYSKDNIYKIGCTRHLKKRLKIMNSTRIIQDQFKLIHFWKTVYYYTLESQAHKLFRNFRLNNEFFQVSLNEIIFGIDNLKVETRNSLVTHYDILLAYLEDNYICWNKILNTFLINYNKIVNEDEMVIIIKKLISANDKFNLYQFISNNYYTELLNFVKKNLLTFFQNMTM